MQGDEAVAGYEEKGQSSSELELQPKKHKKYRVLIAEDEAPLRNLLKLSLEEAGYEVIPVENGRQAVEVFDSQPVDIAILDIMMPWLDGFSVCRHIRKRSDVPIIMLTALGRTDDLVQGFELGADDYITKPFTFKEVEARIQAILRRVEWTQERSASSIISIGRVTIDSDAHEVFVGGEPRHLTPIEFRLLYYLMSHAGQTIPKATLFREVWGYDLVEGTNLVEVGIRRLREKIEEDPSHPRYILTVRGAGYRFREPS
ncbi:MAG: response regulator transcription factor [Anaerolineae bacterium]|nr:response regulator transcription factor [Anaerolineae bacterium]